MPMLRSRPDAAARPGSPGPDQDAPGVQGWKGPAAPRIKSAVLAVVGVAVAVVFFPVWFGVPVAVALAAWNLGLVVRAACARVDAGDGLLVLRVGWITRRVALTDISAVMVDQAKVSIARADGGEISLYAWRKSRLDGWLGVPVVAADIGHAVASAVALAKDGQDTEPESADPSRARLRAGTSARRRSALAAALLGVTGAAALASAFLVRLAWPHDPVMTVLSVILAAALGITGLFYLIFTLWLMLPRRSA